MAKRAGRQTIDELAAQVAELRRSVATLKAENARLRAELAALRGDESPPDASGGDEEPNAAPVRVKTVPRWINANVVTIARNRPRRTRVAVPGRHRAVPDQQIVHAPSHCSACAHALGRGRVIRRRQVIVLPPVRAQVIEHVVLERRCRHCGTVCRGTMPDLSAEVGAGRRVGWSVVAQVAVLRTKLRLPVRSVQWLEQVWGLRVSVGELCGLFDEAARAGRGAYDAVLADARASPAVHVDETGWRQAGRNGWIWTVCTPTLRYFEHSPSRAGVVARRLVGAEYGGVTVSDFYTAYDQLDGLHQRCWAHLLRDIHDLKTQHVDDPALQRWAEDVHALYVRALGWAAQANGSAPTERDHARRAFERELLALCRSQPATSPQATLCQRVERSHPELFMFVADPAVPATNNEAERALRPLVIARKISGAGWPAAASSTTTP